MNRVWIRGTSGSGKTTLGHALATRLGIPAIDLDDLYWLPGWQTRDRETFQGLVAEVLDQPRWVLMGNYTKVAPGIEAAADTLLWLDYPLPVPFLRILRRTVRRIVTGEPCCNGNRESFRKSFLAKESVIWWMLTTHARRHRECLACLRETPPPGQVRRRLRSPRETKRWLEALDSSLP